MHWLSCFLFSFTQQKIRLKLQRVPGSCGLEVSRYSIVYSFRGWITMWMPLGAAVCAPLKLSLSPWSCIATCSPLIAPLKPDLAADLLAVCHHILNNPAHLCIYRVCVRERERVKDAKCDSQQGEAVFKPSLHQPSVNETCVFMHVIALVHPSMSIRHAADHVTFHRCNCAPFVTA